MALVEVSTLAGMLIKYEEDFILCSKMEESMGVIYNNNTSFVGGKSFKESNNTEKLNEISH